MNWKSEDAQTIREMIRHECDVSNNRLAYFATLHGLLFAALGFAWKDAEGLIPLLSFLGISTSLSVMLLLIFAETAISNLIKVWDKNKPGDYCGPDVIGYRSKAATLTPIQRFFLPSFVLPILLIVTWLLVPFIK